MVNARVPTAREQDSIHETGFLRIGVSAPPTSNVQQMNAVLYDSGKGGVEEQAGCAYPSLADASKASKIQAKLRFELRPLVFV